MRGTEGVDRTPVEHGMVYSISWHNALLHFVFCRMDTAIDADYMRA